MNQSVRGGVAVLRAVVILGVVGAACLTRPVRNSDPNLTTTFTNIIHNQAVDKIDLLFMIDNSASMGDKQALLAQAVPDMITRLVSPNCVDTVSGKVFGKSDANGQCTMGKAEFPAVHDMHIGIVSSSLGGRGGDTCINRGGDTETPLSNAQPFNFLAWYPTVGANSANPASMKPPVPPETTVGKKGMAGTLIGDFTEMIQGVHEHGCGFEAQNEAWYRFLVQPDPFDSIQVPTTAPMANRANLVGVDSTILQQRKAFLRPDSLLTVIVVTDENEEVANPLAIGGEGWLYESAPFPASPSNGAPQGTIECKANPSDPMCTSCAFASVQMSPNFDARCPKDPPGGSAGFLDPSNDAVNVRFFNQKQRFGVFAGYPISRYIRGLQSPSVPDRRNEVDGSGNYVGDQDKFANCVNPIFAQNLPTDPKADLCHLERGQRTPDLVYYAAIGGVPHQLLQAQAGVDPECPAGTLQTNCPQKTQLTDADWLKITGKDPAHYDFNGIDQHMLESMDPRNGLPGPTSNDSADPINGREWNTAKSDLQFACIFDLVDSDKGTPAAKDCTNPKFAGACDCAGTNNSRNTPLCQKTNGIYTTTQIKGKAYPSVREMAIAHAMATSPGGVQGIVSSLCPIHTSYAGGNMTDPLYGYRPAANAIVDRLKNALNVQCLPQKLPKDKTTGEVPCLILVTLPKPSSENQCNTIAGLGVPPADILARFRAAQSAAWQASGGLKSGAPDPNTLPVCQLKQLTPKDNPPTFGADGTCSGSTSQGWCYVEGVSAGSCPQQLLFTLGEPPPAATVNLQCIEQASGVLEGEH